MLRLIILTAFGVGLAIAAPQFLTFKDGNIGVNFGGYSAQAGLGGLLTGNAAHGGLSASAGTPWGANAAAGLGGTVNGDSAGTAYAGAKLNDEIGASSVIGGSTGEQQQFGFAGAESHANGNAVIKTIVGAQEPSSLPANPQGQQQQQQQQQQTPSTATATKTITKHVLFSKDQTNAGNVQKIKPPKKFVPETNVPISVEQKTTLTPAAKVVTFAVNSGIKSDTSTPPLTEGSIQKEPVFISHHQHKHRLHPAGRRRLHLQKQFIFLPPPQQYEPERWDGNFSQQKHVIKSIGGISPSSQTAAPMLLQASEGSGYEHKRKSIQFNSGILTSAFNIPIGILSSIRDNLQPISVQKQLTYSKST